MSGLSTRGRVSVLCRSASSMVSRHLSDSDGANSSSTENSPRAFGNDLLSDFGSLEAVFKQIEISHTDAHRALEQLGSVATVNQLPTTENFLRETNKSQFSPHVRKPLQDSPTYLQYQKELVFSRQINGCTAAKNESICEDSSVCKGMSSDSVVRTQLEEALASNHMMQRALVVVQRRLRAVEKERDELRAQCEAFRGGNTLKDAGSVTLSVCEPSHRPPLASAQSQSQPPSRTSPSSITVQPMNSVNTIAISSPRTSLVGTPAVTRVLTSEAIQAVHASLAGFVTPASSRGSDTLAATGTAGASPCAYSMPGGVGLSAGPALQQSIGAA